MEGKPETGFSIEYKKSQYVKVCNQIREMNKEGEDTTELEKERDTLLEEITKAD